MRRTLYCTTCSLAVLVLALTSQNAHAQFKNKALAVGSLSNVYTEVGAEQESYTSGYGLRWPAVYRQGVLRAGALWIGAQNVVSPDGDETYAARVVHIGPRVTGRGEYFPTTFETVSRFEPPVVMVDGFESFDTIADNDRVDADLPGARAIVNEVNTLLGITLSKRVLAFSQEFHDNYHVQEYVLTNTGNADDDEDIELPNQTLEGVYLHFQKRYVFERARIPGSGWGANVMNDIVGDGVKDYETDLRAQYTWLGNSLNANIDPLGGSLWDDNESWAQEGDSTGRLTTTQFVGTVTLHADASASDESDDPAQPSMTGHIDADDLLTSANDAYNESKMVEEYNLIANGVSQTTPQSLAPGTAHMYPHHAELVEMDGDGDGDYTTVGSENPMRLGKAGGWTATFSYGPYTLAPGENVRIVIAEAVDGLNREESAVIGRRWKQAAGGKESVANNAFGNSAPIWYDLNGNGSEDAGETRSKNAWWWSGKDSLFQTFEKAVENYESGYAIPEAPLPPRTFTVDSGVDRVSLAWETYDGESPAGGFQLYRTFNSQEGAVEDDFVYELIAELPGSATSYEDSDVTRGVNYYYYIQSVGDVNTDGTAMTPTGTPLKSNRYWTQTYDPATLKRPPGETTSSFRVVPNPYNIAQAAGQVRYNEQDRLGFLDVPGNCTIRIYTERGDLVKTIEHDDESGDEFWDLTTDSRQVIVSGLYIVVVDNNETGERVTKKFVVIR